MTDQSSLVEEVLDMPPGRPTIKSRQVAAELRRYRIDSGFSTTAAGELLGISQSQVSRVETGSRGLKPDEVAAMLGLYQVPARRRDEIMQLVRQSAEAGWWVSRYGTQLPQQWEALISYERQAVSLYSYGLALIPGLLQTSDYARSIIERTAELPLSDVELDAKVSARLGRQGIFSRAAPPAVSVVLHEPALRLPVGGPGVMRRQLRHLLELTERPQVEIRVIPLDVGPHPGLDGSFVIMDLADQPSVVYQESKTRNAFLEQHDVEIYKVAWTKISTFAMDPDKSGELIAGLADDYSTE